MIDRKTWLVARREYVENIRTKTFWIGIFMLPVIYGLIFGAQIFLQGAKEVRPYAVIDRTENEWLSSAIERRADQGDVNAAGGPIIAELMKFAKEAEDGAPLASVTAQIGPATERAMEQADSDVQRRFLELLGKSLETAFGGLEGDETMSDLSEVAFAASSDLIDFYSGLSEQERALLEGRLDREKYRHLTLDELGIDPAADDVEQQLNKKIADGTLFAWFELPAEPIETDEGARYVSNNVTDDDLRNWYAANATEEVRSKRIAKLKLSKDDARSLREEFRFDEQQVSETGEAEEVESSEKVAQFAPMAFVYLLWIAVFTAAQMLLTNTVEEKSNRLIEVLLSSVSPMQLMSGKVLGIAATGLTIVISWVLTSLIGIQFIPAGSGLAELELERVIANPLYLGSFIGYFLAGYLLYGAMLVALGSVCSSLKEAQNLMQPIFLLLFIPLVAMFFVVQEPNGTVARVLTYIPLFTPFMMMNRAGGPPPTWEYIASSILLLITLWIAFKGAAKIFRIGILMTGKPPKVSEIFRWLRAPVGEVAVQPAASSSDASKSS